MRALCSHPRISMYVRLVPLLAIFVFSLPNLYCHTVLWSRMSLRCSIYDRSALFVCCVYVCVHNITMAIRYFRHWSVHVCQAHTPAHAAHRDIRLISQPEKLENARARTGWKHTKWRAYNWDEPNYKEQQQNNYTNSSMKRDRAHRLRSRVCVCVCVLFSPNPHCFSLKFLIIC